MDVTQLFKACVKTVRLRNKNINVDVTNSKTAAKQSTMGPKLDENVKKKEKLFEIKARNIKYQLVQLRNFLIENRASYMKFACHLKRFAQMTDDERDLIDSESEKILNICYSLIEELKLDLRNFKTKNCLQLIDHLNLVMDLLTIFHKGVSKIHSDQKKYRMQREIETYKLLKLNSDRKKSTRNMFGDENDSNAANQKRDVSKSMQTESKNKSRSRQDEVEPSASGLRNRKAGLSSKLSLDDEIITNHNSMLYEEDELSAEDIQMFESENTQLLKELKGLSDEVEQIERNVVDIANLQEIFSEKVTLQKHDIDRISNTVVGATENVRDANEQIKRAIQRNAGLRVYVLFFLIVMSFSLLFLDWYND